MSEIPDELKQAFYRNVLKQLSISPKHSNTTVRTYFVYTCPTCKHSVELYSKLKLKCRRCNTSMLLL